MSSAAPSSQQGRGHGQGGIPVSNRAMLEAVFGAQWPRAHVVAVSGEPARAPRTAWTGGAAVDDLHRFPVDVNTYYTVSLFRGGRRRESEFAGMHVVVLDDVGPKVPVATAEGLLGAPSYRLETSPGNEQWGYVLDPPERDAARVKAFQKALLAALLGEGAADPGQRDVTRLARLPVGRNRKPAHGAAGYACRMTEWEPGRTFAFDEIERLVRECLGVKINQAANQAAGQATTSVVPDTDMDTDNRPASAAAPGAPGGGPGGGPGGSSSPLVRPLLADEIADMDVVLDVMRGLGMVLGQARDTGMGRGHDVRCPWLDEHTDRAESGAVYVAGHIGGGRFKCHHGHCATRTPRELWHRMDELLCEDSGGLDSMARHEFTEVDPASVPAPLLIWADPFGFWSRTAFMAPAGRFVDVETGDTMDPPSFDRAWTPLLDGRGANVLPRVLVGAGKNAREKAIRPTDWYCGDTTRRRLVDGLTWWPGQSRVVPDPDTGRILVNEWQEIPRPLRDVPDALVDERAVGLWLDGLFWHVFERATLDGWEIGELVLDWLALVLGAPGTQVGFAVLLTGAQGVGKDMVLKPLVDVLGAKRATTLNPGGLDSEFTSWIKHRLVQVPELRQTTRGAKTGHDQYQTLKALVDPGKRFLTANEKHQPRVMVRNVAALWLTSNDATPIPLADDDRRLLVVRSTRLRKPQDFYQRLGLWLDTPAEIAPGVWASGTALVHEYLCRRWARLDAPRRLAVTVGGAPMTEDKEAMIADAADPLLDWLRTAMQVQPPAPTAWPDIVTTEFVLSQIIRAIRAQDEGLPPRSRVPYLGRLGQMLREIEATPLDEGKQVRLADGRKVRLWAVRNTSRYVDLSPAELRDCFMGMRLP